MMINPSKIAFFAGAIILAALLSLQMACRNPAPADAPPAVAPLDSTAAEVQQAPEPLFLYAVPRNIRVRDYFSFIDSVVSRFDSLTPYPLSEHLLVRANPWLIDTLENTDYYRRMAQGEFIYDQRKMVVLHPGDTLQIPDTSRARLLQAEMDSTWIDINIPEFRLRIVRGQSDTVYSMQVRVGQNKKRYQEALSRVEDLRTQPGVGRIVRINRDPTLFVDPHTGRRLTTTLRDDGRRTRMPMIPWLEPEINGRRLGQMIHPTTNPESLGKAYSNGCIGCSESDAWRLYYHAPVGTKTVIRYDPDVVLPNGDTLHFQDIYGWKKKKE